MNDQHSTTERPRLFAVVELFGHARIAGEVSEQTFGGSSFVRVDVPAIEVQVGYGLVNSEELRRKATRTIPAHTRSFGASAIYAISWCDETTMLLAARDIEHEPLRAYSTKEAIDSLPAEARHRLLTSSAAQRSLEDGHDDDLPY